jgi:hypothetical protein
MHTILKPTFEREDERGVLREILNEGTWETVLCGTMRVGAVLGNHYHKITQVFFYLTSGSACIRTIHVVTGERDQFTLASKHGILLTPDESHAIRFLEPSEFIMLKSRRYDPADPDTYSYPVPE